MKYIIFENERFVIIPKCMNHSDCEKIGAPLSAGFCLIKNYNNLYKVKCWGESISLNIKSKPNDNLIIEKKLNNENY